MTLRDRIARIVLVYDGGQDATEEDDEAARQEAKDRADRVLDAVADWFNENAGLVEDAAQSQSEQITLARALRQEMGKDTRP